MDITGYPRDVFELIKLQLLHLSTYLLAKRRQEIEWRLECLTQKENVVYLKNADINVLFIDIPSLSVLAPQVHQHPYINIAQLNNDFYEKSHWNKTLYKMILNFKLLNKWNYSTRIWYINGNSTFNTDKNLKAPITFICLDWAFIHFYKTD